MEYNDIVGCFKYKAFISVPMKDKSKEEIDALINYMKVKARNIFKSQKRNCYMLDYTNTIVEEKPPYNTQKQAVWYLGKSIEILSQCDVLVCLKNIDEKYNGCIIEKEIAKRYGLLIIEVELD